ncbi:hypothetical protein ACFY3U_04330 [Micromonospora sp. NPDC000089]|uniref:hypothetical protein n=1 Tax=unclassified Micromonospora TaxID=2617518 RepID=UPI003699E702
MVVGVGRLLGAVATVLVGVLLTVGTGTAAQAGRAAPKPPPAGVDITGDGLTEPLRLRSDSQPSAVLEVLDQVNWFGRTGIGAPTGPETPDLGPRYTVVVLAGETPKQRYDLYPLATGGPRVFRPAKQPDGHATKAGWFLGRLTMSEALRTAGVPLERQFDTVSGGAGGGERVIPQDSLHPGDDIGSAVGELQRLLLLNVGVVLVITSGLAGIALLVRRRTR